MKKIPSLFKRDYGGTRLVYNEVVPGSEWVINGEGRATVKIDGTACMIRDGKLYKRYDRKLNKSAHRRKKRNPDFVPTLADFKPAPVGWEACEPEPNEHTGHWPGWVPIGDEPESKYHREAWERCKTWYGETTVELVGPAIQGNPYSLERHELWIHGMPLEETPPRDFAGLCNYFKRVVIEGIVCTIPTGAWSRSNGAISGYRGQLRSHPHDHIPSHTLAQRPVRAIAPRHR